MTAQLASQATGRSHAAPLPVRVDTGGEPPDLSAHQLERALKDHSRFLHGSSSGRRLDLSFRRLSGLCLAGQNLSHGELRGAVMVGCDLSNARLIGASLLCADLTGARMISCNLERADLRGTRFDRAQLVDAVFDGADCREGVLVFQNPLEQWRSAFNPNPSAGAPASFSEADLTRASFRQANLEGVSFQGASVVEVHFEQSVLSGAKFSGASVLGSNFVGAILDETDFSGADVMGCLADQPLLPPPASEGLDERLRIRLQWHQEWVASLSHRGKQLVVKDCVMRGLRLEDADLSAAEFRNVDLSDSVLRNTQMAMSRFVDCKINNCDLRGADARGVRFTGSDLTGSDLTGADFSAVTSKRKETVRWKADFTGSNLSRTILDGGVLTDCVFHRANLIGAMATRTRFNRSDFAEANLALADFRGANLEGAVFTAANLQGAKGVAGRA